MRELGVRLAQQQGDVNIQHIDGKKNIADLFTKEIKDSHHFQEMAFTITMPQLLVNYLAEIKGGVGQAMSSWMPKLLCQAILILAKQIPTALLGARTPI